MNTYVVCINEFMNTIIIITTNNFLNKVQYCIVKMRSSSSSTNNRIIKISARAFTNPFLSSSSSSSISSCNKGGNPVTIFHFSKHKQHSIPNSKLRSYLAQTCSWESVISYSGYSYNNNSRDHGTSENTNSDTNVGSISNRIWFYMPSGEEVSFCAHAAMAALSIIKNIEDTNSTTSDGNLQFLSGIIEDNQEENFENNHGCVLLKNTARVCQHNYQQHFINKSNNNDNGNQQTNEVILQMDSQLYEKEVNREITMKLLEQVGLTYEDILDSSCTTHNYPSFINSSVARYKTLIPLKSINVLNSAQNPTDAILFRDLCDEIDSTGLYLYAPISLSSYECRQFPRYSGYPEDPATGISAAALANSLFCRGIYDDHFFTKEEKKTFSYDMFQGTAMEKPSKIKITLQESTKGKDKSIILSCSGIVEIDNMDEIELPKK